MTASFAPEGGLPGAGLLDTSVVIDFHHPDVRARLPELALISAVTLAELVAGPHASNDPLERAERQRRLQQVESLFEPLPLDAAVARSYGVIYAAVRSAGRQPRRRFADLLIAAVAHANRMPLYTRNPQDFAGLESLVRIVRL